MKNVKAFITAVALLIALFPAHSFATTVTEPTPMSTPKLEDTKRAEALLGRLDEIKGMDKSSLSPSERKQLRKETRSIKQELKQISGGVYLSTGAVILLIVLLIVLL